ncbi:MAG TPA: tetratricopeptide repeat protein, partial [Longimicrobiales bacterium]|nr:tetratricopeptide repeat protein [Longimicrobiales bacterium]
MASSLRDEISRLELLHAAHPEGLVFPHLADAYRRAGRYTQAESLLDAGLRRHAEYSSAHVILGRLRMDQGKRQEAEDAFRHVLDLDPHNQVALEQLAEIAAGRGRLKEAVTLFRRLSRIGSDDALLLRVESLERQIARGGAAANGRGAAGAPRGGNGGGRPEQAGATAVSAVRPPASPGHGAAEAETAAPLPEPGEVVTETMAELYARQGLHQRAAAVYQQLLDRAPGDARLRAKLEAVEGVRRGWTEPGRATPIREELRSLLTWTPDTPRTRAPTGPDADRRPGPETPV